MGFKQETKEEKAMKKVLFATTALAALAVGGMASAQGITLFGDARMGILYDEARDDNTARTTSRVRFGVNMTGETDAGITFGATVRADNAIGGSGGIAGNAFISGEWGTVTMGDTSGADENWVGDVPGNFSLTGLGDLNETPFFSNGGGFGSDRLDFASNPLARPTLRYDFDIAGFGISLSSQHLLNEVAIGAGYAGEFGNAAFSAGIGYNNFAEFNAITGNEIVQVGTVDGDGRPHCDFTGAAPADCESTGVIGADISSTVKAGDQWSFGMNGDWENFSVGIIGTTANSGNRRLDTAHVGGSFGWDAWSVGAYYSNILRARSEDGNKAALDGKSSYGITGQYDLGGGAKVAGGWVQDYDNNNVADFGIKMSF
jgi:outer membrane protein OmpU